MRKLVFGLLFACLLCSRGWAKIEFIPHYSDARFQPSDTFHAGCPQTMDIVFSNDTKSTLDALNAVLQYDSKEIHILKVVPYQEKELNLTYMVQDDTLTLNKLKSDTSPSSSLTYTITFQPKATSTRVLFRFVQGSYMVDKLGKMITLEGEFGFDANAVPECDPDIIPPTIALVYPPVSGGNLPLDSYFVFDIADMGKGLNKDSLSISIDDTTYTADTTDFSREGNQVKLFPDFWLPIDSTIDVHVKIADKQVYGGPNITEEVFTFHSATGLLLLNDIDVNDLRTLVGVNKSLHASKKECALLVNMINALQSDYKKIGVSIGKRLHCDDMFSGFLIGMAFSGVYQTGLFIPLEASTSSYLSLFAIIGWVLFGVALLLKFFYIYVYKKHKKLVRKHGLL